MLFVLIAGYGALRAVSGEIRGMSDHPLHRRILLNRRERHRAIGRTPPRCHPRQARKRLPLPYGQLRLAVQRLTGHGGARAGKARRAHGYGD